MEKHVKTTSVYYLVELTVIYYEYVYVVARFRSLHNALLLHKYLIVFSRMTMK